MDVHNTALKKNASEIFESNAFDDIEDILQKTVPTIEIQPYINVVKSTVVLDANAVLYDVPTDKDFYLTNVSLSCAGDGVVNVASSAEVVFQDKNGIDHTVRVKTETNGAGQCSKDLLFPFRGVLLNKGSTIRYSAAGSAGSDIMVLIAGYLGSDRSGL